VIGGIHRTTREPDWHRIGHGAAIVGGITLSLGMVLLGAVLVLGMPGFTRDAGALIRRKPWQALGIGCATLSRRADCALRCSPSRSSGSRSRCCSRSRTGRY
jgi:hypothetical protein